MIVLFNSCSYKVKSIALICDVADHRIRLHRAPHYSAQNEAERTDAATGEALVSGKPVELPNDPFHGLTTEEIDKMALKETDQHCVQWKMRNTWAMAGEISSQAQRRTRPWEARLSHFRYQLPSKSEKQILFFLAKYLIKWNKSSSQNKTAMCGNALFEKLQKMKEDHVRQGQYFLEYLKFSCTQACEGCNNEGWTTGVELCQTFSSCSPRC